MEVSSKQYSNAVLHWKGLLAKDLLKVRKTPPCSSAIPIGGEEEIINENTRNKPSSLCLAFNTIFVEKNLKDIMKIMKFSLDSPLPFSLKNMVF